MVTSPLHADKGLQVLSCAVDERERPDNVGDRLKG